LAVGGTNNARVFLQKSVLPIFSRDWSFENFFKMLGNIMSDIVFEEKSAESISANSTLKKKLKVRQK